MWELTTPEQDMDPELFRMMVSQLDPEMPRQSGEDQLPDVETDVEPEVDFGQTAVNMGLDFPLSKVWEYPTPSTFR